MSKAFPLATFDIGLSYRFGDIIQFTKDAVGNDVWQRHQGTVIPFVSLSSLSDHDLALAYRLINFISSCFVSGYSLLYY
jgi:hypothetical protein